MRSKKAFILWPQTHHSETIFVFTPLGYGIISWELRDESYIVKLINISWKEELISIVGKF